MPLTWSQDISVGVHKIDNQHQFLFYVINKIERMGVDISGEELEKVVDSLSEYVQIHFQTEEEYFSRYNYAEKEEHEKEHSAFVDKVISCRKRLDRQEPVATKDLYAFLAEWITNHIKGSDMKFKGLFPEEP
jgi:hemerythrin-like metal-binding protein